jgi:hypothetical protein
MLASYGGDRERLKDKGRAQTKPNGEGTKARLCRHFQDEGLCPFGQKCIFAHGESDKQDQFFFKPPVDSSVVDSCPATQNPKTRPEAYKTTLCRNWQDTQSCAFGDKCAFAHGSHELRVKVPVPSDDPIDTSPNPMVEQLLMLLDIAEGRVRESEMQTQRLHTALCVTERDLEARCAQAVESNFRQAQQREEALRAALQQQDAQLAAHKLAYRDLEKQVADLKMQLHWLQQSGTVDEKKHASAKGAWLTHNAEEVLEWIEGVLGGPNPTHTGGEAFDRLRVELKEALGMLEAVEQEQKKVDTKAAGLFSAALILRDRLKRAMPQDGGDNATSSSSFAMFKSEPVEEARVTLPEVTPPSLLTPLAHVKSDPDSDRRYDSPSTSSEPSLLPFKRQRSPTPALRSSKEMRRTHR